VSVTVYIIISSSITAILTPISRKHHSLTRQWQQSISRQLSWQRGSWERTDDCIHRCTCRATDNDDQNDAHIDRSPHSDELATVASHTHVHWVRSSFA